MLIEGILSCFRLLNPKQKRDYSVVVVLATLAALTEILGMAAIIPVISALVDFEGSVKRGYLLYLYGFVGEPEKSAFLTGLTLCAVVLVWFGGLSSMLSQFASQRFFRRLNADIAARVYRRYMHQPIEEFYARPTSEFLRNVNGVSERLATGVFGASAIILSRTIQISAMLAVLLYLNPLATAVIFAVISTCYLGIYLGLKPRIVRISGEKFVGATQMQQLALGSYQGYRTIIIDQQLDKFSSRFDHLKKEASRKTANMAIIGSIPRRLIEAASMTILIVVSYLIGRSSGGGQSFVFVMGLFAVAAYRILPSAQQVYSAFNRITSALVVYRNVEREWNGLPEIDRVAAGDGLDIGNCRIIEIDNLSYSIGGKRILNNVCMKIPLAGVVRIGGPSGIGKSTLLELIAGLRKPESGEIFLDGRPMTKVNLESWWACISYLSQGGYLFAGSVLENIVLPQAVVDQERLCQVADICGLGFLGGATGFDPEFQIAENGSNLSGGQRARVLLARALYKNTGIVFLDEAFAALDVESARTILEQVRAFFPERCIVIVSHRDAELPGDVKEYVIAQHPLLRI